MGHWYHLALNMAKSNRKAPNFDPKPKIQKLKTINNDTHPRRPSTKRSDLVISTRLNVSYTAYSFLFLSFSSRAILFLPLFIRFPQGPYFFVHFFFSVSFNIITMLRLYHLNYERWPFVKTKGEVNTHRYKSFSYTE